MNQTTSSRRKFLTTAVSGLSSAWFALNWPAALQAAAHARQAAESGDAKFEFFSSEQAAEVEAIAAQIIPTDETAGASEAQVISFIDRALVSFDRARQATYTQGLSELRARVATMFPGKDKFAELSLDQQIHLLTAIEHSDFFEWVRIHTVMGFLARPEYGGNRDKTGWKLIGMEDQMIFEPPFGYYDADYRKNGGK